MSRWIPRPYTPVSLTGGMHHGPIFTTAIYPSPIELSLFPELSKRNNHVNATRSTVVTDILAKISFQLIWKVQVKTHNSRFNWCPSNYERNKTPKNNKKQKKWHLLQNNQNAANFGYVSHRIQMTSMFLCNGKHHFRMFLWLKQLIGRNEA